MAARQTHASSTIRRVGALVLAATLFALGTLISATAAQARMKAPVLQGPANDAQVQSLPAFTWGSVRGAASYQFEFSADGSFSSGVNGFGTGPVSLDTTAITNDHAIPDGTYYWRARAVTSTDATGRWSPTRILHKAWSTAPQLLSPLAATVDWPSTPLLLTWAPVPYAVTYDVYVATDPGLSNLVLGSVSSPYQVQGPQFAFPTTLAPGTYYWAIAPVDAAGDVGKRSAISSFTWAWPSDTTVSEADDSADQSVVEPQFSWAPIAGAASYGIEISRAQDFASGSDVIDQTGVVGDSYTPTQILPNETDLYWRVRALDANGDAGDWNVGQPFTESFDQTTPTIPNLQLVDQSGNPQALGETTSDPIVTWSPVPGASSYEVQVGGWATGGCDFTDAKTTNTSNTTWTVIASPQSTAWEPPGWPGPNGGGGISINGSGAVCVRVAAQRDDGQLGGGSIESATSQLGNSTDPAFNYVQPTTPAGTLEENSVQQCDATATPCYVKPQYETTPTERTTPLLEWNPVPGAAGYFVAISYNQNMTNIVPNGLGYTTSTAWAPPISLLDETNAYFWEIIPVDASDGNPPSTVEQSSDDDPQSFNKSSSPPNPLSPANGATVQTQPTFQWDSAQGARNYTLQIAGDTTFANPVEQVTTDSTSYTANNTLPADKTLYWRVRANDLNNNGLNWSTIEQFNHLLPVPTPSAANPTGGSTIPDLSWSPVTGATSYNMFVTQANGTTESFPLDTPGMTPTEFYGTGIWRWEVQAVFPGGATSAYFSPEQAYVRTIPAPSGVHATKSGTRIVISWAPNSVAKQYQIQLSTTDGFASPVASDTTDNTVWVPQINAATAAMKLYWRLAVVDQGGNVGAYDTGIFHAPAKPKPKKHHKSHKRGKSKKKKKKKK
jgi:hypothetical protein